jgi:hypothetical protein
VSVQHYAAQRHNAELTPIFLTDFPDTDFPRPKCRAVGQADVLARSRLLTIIAAE